MAAGKTKCKMPLSNKQALSWRKGKQLLPLDAVPEAKVIQQGVTCSACQVLPQGHGWGAGGQWEGEGESSTMVLYRFPNNIPDLGSGLVWPLASWLCLQTARQLQRHINAVLYLALKSTPCYHPLLCGKVWLSPQRDVPRYARVTKCQ